MGLLGDALLTKTQQKVLVQKCLSPLIAIRTGFTGINNHRFVTFISAQITELGLFACASYLETSFGWDPPQCIKW
jgi:hypothetical protein